MTFSAFLPIIALSLYTGISLIFFMHANTTIKKVIASTMLAITMSILAYTYIPYSNYDLVRHQNLAMSFAGAKNLSDFFKMTVGYYEILPQLFMYIISRIGDYNLLQTIPVFIGYAVLFYMLIDYQGQAKLENWKFIALLLVIAFGQNINYYFSGLFNYLAINLFAFAIYLEYVKEHKKLPFFIYIILPFIHMSMFMPIMVLLVFKMKKQKINTKFLIVFVVFLFLFEILSTKMADILNLEYLSKANASFINYTTHNNGAVWGWYGGINLLMSILKTIIVSSACYIEYKQGNETKLFNLTNLMNISVIILSLSTIVMTRFTSLTLFISLPLIANSMKVPVRKCKSFCLLILMTGILFLAISVWIMLPRYDLVL